jgi:hypothetical protein
VTDSSTGGYLYATNSGLEGQGLQRAIQQWIVGVTGLDGALVRPRWQLEPPNVPEDGQVWVAFGLGNASVENYPYVEHDPTGDGKDTLQRHERFEVLCSAYDLGSTGLADETLSLFRDGIAIPQNLEGLRQSGISLIEVGDMISVPVLLKQRWYYRVDMTVVLRRQITREYAVLNVVSASGEVLTSDITVNFATP